MRQLIRFAARFYPAQWRRRYGREFDALLEDMQPRFRDLLDVLTGALAMRMKTLATITVACAVVGAVVGGLIAVRTPTVFAASGTILLEAADATQPMSKTAEELRASVRKALEQSGGTARGALLAVRSEAAQAMTVRVTYVDRDAANAQRVAQQLTTAVAGDQTDATTSAKVLDVPELPQSPVARDVGPLVAAGSAIGLAAGGAIFLLFRARRRRPSSEA